MKTKIFTLLAIAAVVLNAQNVSAKIFRVGYFGTAISGQDYGDFQSANNAASRGDTLLIFPGSYSGTINKKLVVIGYGYAVIGAGFNPDLQATVGSLSIGIIYLAAGSDSAIFEGLDNLGIRAADNSTLGSILFNRCSLNFIYGDRINTFTNFKITQSLVTFSPINGNLCTFQFLFLENNIINSGNLGYTTASACTGAFNNNIFTSVPNFNNGGYTLSNNVFLGTTAPTNTAACTFMNNIATGNTIPSGNGNQPNANLSAVFVGYPTQGTYSFDGRYVLAPSSPAIGAGTLGAGTTDIGIFGGANPYHLSGIPAIPSFYKITASSPIANTNPYTITFSVRSNN